MYFEDMYYTKEGSGNAVLFLHGWGCEHTVWARQTDQLKKRFCVITLDFYGFGKSATPPSNANLTFYAEKVSDLLAFLKIKKVSIVAHSFGGRVAILLCSLVPEKIEKIVLVNSAGLRRFSLKRSLKILAYKFCKKLAKIGLVDKKVTDSFGSSDYKALNGDLRGVFRSITQQDLSKGLAEIRCPALLIWGEKDRETPLWIAKKMKRKIKDSALIFIGKGHFGAYENPTVFNACLNSFLQ